MQNSNSLHFFCYKKLSSQDQHPTQEIRKSDDENTYNHVDEIFFYFFGAFFVIWFDEHHIS